MTAPKWFANQRFDPQFLRLVGVYIAACGCIERCIFNGIIHMRQQGVTEAQPPIHTAFGKRHDQWLKSALHFIRDNADDVHAAQHLYDRTDKLMELRHILVHSFWFGQDAENVLYVQQVIEKRGKLGTRSLEIEMGYLAGRARELEPLVDGHMHFLNNRLIRARGGEHLYRRSAVFDPRPSNPPIPRGWPGPGQKRQRLGLKNK